MGRVNGTVNCLLRCPPEAARPRPGSPAGRRSAGLRSVLRSVLARRMQRVRRDAGRPDRAA